MFKNTRLLGIKVPFHVNFEEVNLRFYVKRHEGNEWKRGVVFIKEIVPRWAIAYVANTIYKENYESLPMAHIWNISSVSRTIEYSWKKSGAIHSFKVLAGNETFHIPPQSETEFITEHYWGYARVNEKKSYEYKVDHPRWKVYDIKDHHIDVDFGSVYGGRFGFLSSAEPHSIILAEGSEITVEKRKAIIKNQ